ncbi:Hypothetical protein SRAE_0000069800 [Strongyloides ratti]|uniref:Uncharacterized protein n=1 Tax=Strongyloides ratti TaxID=34506 RepID=A0A090KVP9_STRRB|nr:Hypothetical protein SRAE_0000069800 [Strongyloides ratti]CEF61580.1 Hypothetical protein SRAE_0000069800 [Strongyloides ratti]
MSAHPETEKHYTIKLKELKNQLQYNVIMLHYVPIEKIVINEYISVYEEYDFRFMVLNFLDYFSSIVKMEDLKWTEYSSDAYLVFFDDTVSEFTNLIKSLIKCPTNKNSFLKMKTIEFGLVINYSATYLSFLNDYGFFKDKLDKCTGFYVLENIARTTISLFINENSKDILKNDSICYKLKCVFFTICSVGISICKIAMKYPNFKRFLFQLQCWLKIITFLNNIENIKNETVSDDNIKKYQENIRQEKIIGKSLYRKFIKKVKKTK